MRAVACFLIVIALAANAEAQTRQPASGATNVSPTAMLTWAPLGSDTPKDVYFSTSSKSLPKVSALQTADTYKPVMLANTTYYWRVDVHVGADVYAGKQWSFKTGSGPAPLVMTCPANLTQIVTTVPVTMNWPAATVSGGVAPISLKSSPVQGSSFNAGTTMITQIATDAAGVSVSCAFTVTVTVSAPIATSPDCTANPPTSPLIDRAGVTWTIGPQAAWAPAGYGVVQRNGVAVDGTATNLEMAYGGAVLHRGTDGSFYQWDGVSWFTAVAAPPCTTSGGGGTANYAAKPMTPYHIVGDEASGCAATGATGYRAYVDGALAADIPAATACVGSMVTVPAPGVPAGSHSAVLASYNAKGESRSLTVAFQVGP